MSPRHACSREIRPRGVYYRPLDMRALFARDPERPRIPIEPSFTTIGDRLAKKQRQYHHGWCKTPKTKEIILHHVVLTKELKPQFLIFQFVIESPMCSFHQHFKYGLGIEIGHQQPTIGRHTNAHTQT